MTRVNNRQSPVPVPDPPVLYHGTPVVLTAGDPVLPGRDVVNSGRGRFVWMSGSVDEARMWGDAKRSRRMANGAHVYRVEPVGPVETCRGAYRCHMARIVEEMTG